MQKHTTNLMSLTTKKRICINRFRKRRNDEKINRIIDDFMYGFAIQLLRSNGLSKASNNSKPVVVIYGDYKCPYCKKTEDRVMPKLKKKYIDTNKIKYQYVNLAFLGKDSIVGSRAQHAVNHYAPEKSLEFQKLMFNQQKDEHKQWITTRLVDKQIDELSISDDTKKKIKTDYKTKGSISWKKAKEDQQIAKKNHIKQTPTAFVNDTKVEDPYDFSSYEMLLENEK